MADVRVHTAASIAALVGGRVLPEEAGTVRIEGVESLNGAGPHQLTFITSPAHARSWRASKAGAALVSQPALDAVAADDRPLIVVSDAEQALVAVLEAFAPPPPLPEPGIHATAAIHPEARIGDEPRIGPYVSVARGAVLGDRVALHAGVHVYQDAVIGNDCTIHSNTVIRERSVLGNRVLIHQNVSIGADGFGYRPAADGTRLLKMPHLGNVILEDDVEIGAGTCVDRGKFSATVVGAGTKIDNLVQIAHNCIIGRNCVIAGMAGLAGSVQVGDWVQIGAQVGVSEGLTIGSGARVGGKSGVMADIPPGETVFGMPAAPRQIALRQAAAIRKLPELLKRLKWPDR